MTQRKLAAVAMTAVMVLSVVSGTVVISSDTARAAGNNAETSPRFEVVDAKQNQDGDLLVTVEATSDEPVSDFRFWYNDLDGGGTQGPTELGDGNFQGATYDDGTPFTPGDTLTQNSGTNGRVRFTFDSGSTPYDYESDAFRINATAYDADYATADTGNRSVAEFNYYRLTAQDHNGNSLPSSPVMLYDDTSNESLGLTVTPPDSSPLVLHCQGVQSGGDCTDPDTGSAGTVIRNSQRFQAPIAAETFSLSEANASGKTDLTRGATTLTADRPTAPVFMSWTGTPGSGSQPTVDSVTVTNAESGSVVWQSSNVGAELRNPAFLQPNTRYTVTLRNSSSFGTVERTITLPTKGLSTVQFALDTGSVSTSEVTGQVVDESGNPVSDAVVMAQPESATGGQTLLYNSTVTDSNGLFSMQVPETDQLGSDIGFRIVGTDTSGGDPIYYPTVDANDGEGYVVQSGQTVIPALTLEQGGRVNIDVNRNTSQDSKLPVGSAVTSLSRVSTAYPAVTRTDGSYAFSTFTFNSRPQSASVSLMSPTTGTNSQVTYNVWGVSNGEPGHVCAGAPSVSQGSTTTSQCELGDAGYLNISVQQYESIRQQSSATAADVESSSFFFENVLVVRNASTDEVVTYLGADTIQQFFLGSDGNSADVRVPVPEGDYHVALRPRGQFGEATSVSDTATYSVSPNAETAVQLDRGERFRIRPHPDRFTPSLTRGADNTLAVYAADPATGNRLSGTDVTVTAQLRYRNGTAATDRVTLGYNTTDGSYDTTTFRPSTLGVDAGTYRLAITTAYTDGTRTYNSTVTGPARVSGFQAGMELRARSVQPGGTLGGQLFAFDDSGGIDASAGNVDIAVYNQNGRQVSSTNPTSGISSGEGSFDITMPDEPGRYRVETRITSDGGKQGIAGRWVRVTEADLEAETDRRVYAPTDPVRLTVEATDATSGAGLADASITARINGQRVTTSTDSNGEATITLDPATYGTGGQWERGYPISVQLNYQTDTGVVTKTVGTGFEVRQFDVRAEPTARTFTPSENATIEVRVPSDQSVNSVAVTELDGTTVDISGDRVTNPSAGVYRVDVGQRAVGDHLATATVTTDSATQQTRTRFAVQSYALSASLDSRRVDVGETVTLDVSVRDPDGAPVSGQSVSASLNSTNPVRTQDTGSATTDSSGDASLSLSAAQSGFHFVKVEVGKQTRYLGLYVNNVEVTLEDGSGDPVDGYEAEPGTTQTIHVDAVDSATGNAVADGTTVDAAAIVYGDPVDLGQATTTDGEASIDFDIPSSVPAREYGLVVRVRGDGAAGLTTGTLNVTGAGAKQVSAATNESALSPGETVQFTSTVTTGDGAPVANEPVDFVVQTDGSADQRVATVQTNGDGVATYDYAVPTTASDGQYVLKTELNESRSIRDYNGYSVRSLDVSVSAADGPYAPGENVTLTVEATDSVTGDPVSATGGTVRLSLPGSGVERSLSPSGTAPYTTEVQLPDDSGITGTRSISVTVQRDGATDTDSTLVAVRDASESANLSIAEPVVAGQAATVTVNGTVDTTGVLTAYSPGANTVAYNDSVTVSSTGDTTTSMTIDSPGTHIVRLTVPGVGAVTEVVDVEAGSGDPTVWTGTDVDANATEFSGTEDIYIKANQPGMTATVISPNATYTVALDSQSGDTYYGVLSEDRADGVYLVRLDSDSATSVDDTIIEVST